MPITARELRAHFGRKVPAPKPEADRIHFVSAGLVPPQFRNRACDECRGIEDEDGAQS